MSVSWDDAIPRDSNRHSVLVITVQEEKMYFLVSNIHNNVVTVVFLTEWEVSLCVRSDAANWWTDGADVEEPGEA